jgi:valyl-tRNA synthetase
MSKLSLNGAAGGDPQESRRLLLELLEQILSLLHPIMPFVSEEIWQQLPGKNARSLMLQPYPQSDPAWIDEGTEKGMEFLMGVVRGVRNLRAEMNCPPGKEVKVIFHGPEQDLGLLRAQESYLRSLARVGAVEYLASGQQPKGAATAVIGGTEVYLPLGDLIKPEEERARLTKETRKVEEELARIQKKLANSEFMGKAKPEVIEKERARSAEYQEKLRALQRSLERLGEMEQGGN